ncbi:MAG: phosphoadenylyl-sulfate reductase [Planctomycetota bacterium]
MKAIPLTTSATLQLDSINTQLDGTPAEDVIRWAGETFGDGLAMTSSFGAQSAVMLHLVTRVLPDLPIILIDTGYLFPETYHFVRDLTKQLSLNLKVFTPRVTPARYEALHGKTWEYAEGLSHYHDVFKVEPLQRALEELNITAWLAGLRSDQTDHRATLRTVEQQDGLYKIHPILRWSRMDVGKYLSDHNLPYHPLVEQGYASIGDTHSSRPISEGEDERAGRFGGFAEECGIHLPQTEAENESLGSSGL